MGATSLAMGEEATPAAQIPDLRDLYERHSQAVYLTALRVTGNPADAEDVLQTVFLRLIDAGLALDASWSPGAYLRRAAANAAIDVLRRKQARRESDIEGGHPPPGGGTEPAHGHDDAAALKERLRQALARLSPENAELFVLAYVEGYSYDELAELMQLGRGTVGSRLHRIRAALQQDLGR